MADAEGMIAHPPTVRAVAPAGREKAPATAWWMLAVLMLLYVLSIVDRGALAMLVVPIQKDLGLSDLQIGFILGPAFAISYSLFGLPLGWASDRFQRRWILFIGLMVWSLAAAGSGLAWSFASLLFARILVGVGEAALSPCAASLVGDAFPRRRLTMALSIYQMSAKLGAGASFMVVALASGIAAGFAAAHWPVLGPLQPWQLTLIITGGPGVALAFLLFSFPEPARRCASHPVAEAVPGEQPADLAFLPYLRANLRMLGLIGLGMALCSIALLSMGAWVPTFLQRRYGLEPLQYGPILSVIHLVAAGTLVFKGMLVDWLYTRGMADAHLRFLSWLMAAAAPLSLAAFLAPSALLFWLPFAIVEIIAGQFLTYIAATVQLVVPVQARGRMMGLFQAAFSIVGMGMGPIIVAVITENVFGDPQRIGWSLAMVVPTSFALALLAFRAVLPAIRDAMARGDEVPLR